jgi:hypothetical protein
VWYSLTVRVVLIDDGQPHDVLEVIDVSDNLVRARTAFLFEIGEELALRFEDAGKSWDAIGRVRGHDKGVTELELSDQTEPK